MKANQNKIYISSFILPSLCLIFSLNYFSLTFPLQTSQSFDFPLTAFFKWPNDKKPPEYFHQAPLISLMEKLYLKLNISVAGRLKKMTCRTCQLSIAKQEWWGLFQRSECALALDKCTFGVKTRWMQVFRAAWPQNQSVFLWESTKCAPAFWGFSHWFGVSVHYLMRRSGRTVFNLESRVANWNSFCSGFLNWKMMVLCGKGNFTGRLWCGGDKAAPESKLELKKWWVEGWNTVKNNFPIKLQHFVKEGKNSRAPEGSAIPGWIQSAVRDCSSFHRLRNYPEFRELGILK